MNKIVLILSITALINCFATEIVNHFALVEDSESLRGNFLKWVALHNKHYETTHEVEFRFN